LALLGILETRPPRMRASAGSSTHARLPTLLTHFHDRSHAHVPTAVRTQTGTDRTRRQLVTAQRYTGLTVAFSRRGGKSRLDPHTASEMEHARSVLRSAVGRFSLDLAHHPGGTGAVTDCLQVKGCLRFGPSAHAARARTRGASHHEEDSDVSLSRASFATEGMEQNDQVQCGMCTGRSRDVTLHSPLAFLPPHTHAMATRAQLRRLASPRMQSNMPRAWKGHLTPDTWSPIMGLGGAYRLPWRPPSLV